MTTKLNELRGVSAVGGSIVREAEGRKGVWEIRIIEAGEGSSGFYPAEMLERDGAKAFPAGTRMFANHDGWEDMFNGGDVRRLIGKTLSPATYRDGALWAEAEFPIAENAKFIEAFWEQIGISINTIGESEIGTIGDYTGNVITKLENDPYSSIDVVVAAGAGGKFIRMIESAQKLWGAPQQSTVTESSARAEEKVKEENMEEELKALTATVATLAAKFDAVESARAQEAAEAEAKAQAEKDQFDAFAAVEQVVEAKLTPALHSRVVEAVKAGNHDVAALIADAKAIQESVVTELTESSSAAGVRIGSPAAGKRDVSTLGIFGGAK